MHTAQRGSQTSQHGITLIELVLYSGLLITVLSVFYQLFAIAGYQKLAQIVEHELYTNGQHAVYDIQQEIEQASLIDEPLLGASSSTLSLDAAAVVITLDNGKILKTKNAVTAPLTDDYVNVESLQFSHYGPSTDSPTVSFVLTLRSRNDVEGRVRTEIFRSSASLR